MKIHIMGASCAGSTTLGEALAKELSFSYFDTDQYFWQPSEIPFTLRREDEMRNIMIKNDMAKSENGIVGGSVINWGMEWLNMFDLVVFLYIPRETRMQRLKLREIERYGDKIVTDPNQAEVHQRFMDWAYEYDDNTIQGRNLKAHLDWLANLTCPLLKIEGDTSVDERLRIVLTKIHDMQ